MYGGIIFVLLLGVAIALLIISLVKKEEERAEVEKQLWDAEEKERKAAIARFENQSRGLAENTTKKKRATTQVDNEELAAAYNALGETYYNGVAVDREKAAEYYLKAYDGGNVLAAYNLGYMYINGDGISEDVQKGMKFLEEAALNDHARANWQIGRLFYYGEKVERNLELSFQYALKAADLGDTDAMVHVARTYDIKAFGAPKRDRDLSKKYYEQAIAKGNINAPWNVGENFYFGLSGYEKDTEQAVHYFKQAAERGSILGQLSLAMCYIRGDAVEQSLMEAKGWLEKAKAQGSVEAKARLGILLASGLVESTEQTLQMGKQMLQEACDDNESDEVAAEAVQYISTCEEKYGSLGLVPAECRAELLRLCQENHAREKRDLKLDNDLKQSDACLRPSLYFHAIDVYSDAKFNMWKLCYEEAEELLRTMEKLHFPSEEDLVLQRRLYGYLAAASYKMAVAYGVHTFREAEEHFNKALPFSEDEEGQLLMSFYQEFKSGEKRPAQERGLVGKVDMLLYQDDTDAVFDIIDDLTREQWFELNVESRLWLGKVLLLGDDMDDDGIELLASVAAEDLGSLNPYPQKAIKAVLDYYHSKNVEAEGTPFFGEMIDWTAVLISKAGADNAIDTLQQYGEMYQSIIEGIQESKSDVGDENKRQKQEEFEKERPEIVNQEKIIIGTEEPIKQVVGDKSVLEQIKEAKEMLDAGIITAEEFREIKAKLIAQS